MSALSANRVTVVEKIHDMLFTLLEENQIVTREHGLKYRRGEAKGVGDCRCLMCGHIWYNCRVTVLEYCRKCGGMLRACGSNELEFSTKRMNHARLEAD